MLFPITRYSISLDYVAGSQLQIMDVLVLVADWGYIDSSKIWVLLVEGDFHAKVRVLLVK